MKSNKQIKGFQPKYLASVVMMMAVAGGSSMVQAGPTIPMGDEGSLTINYELQMWSQYRDARSASNSTQGYDTFLRRNRVTFMGQYNDYVGFYTQLEAGGDSRYGNDERSVYYRDAYVTFDWSDSVRFIAGRFKNTFSRENLEACLEPLTLDRGVVSYTPFGGTRDTGIAMWGNLADAKLQYRVMLSDGREGDDVPRDTPRMTARVHYSAFDPEFSYGYRGTYLGTQRVLTFGAAYDYQNSAVFSDLQNRQDAKNYSAYTVDMFYEEPTAAGTFTLSSAYMNYSVDDALKGNPQQIDNTVGANAEMEAYYVKTGWLFGQRIGVGRLQVFARHEASAYDRNDPYFDQEINAVGANYYLDGQQLKLTFEYADVSFNEQHPDNNLLRDYNQATLGFQMLF